METVTAVKWRWLIFASASLEMFLFSGIFFGWTSLMYVLKREGIFSHLCPKPATNASHWRTGTSTSDNGANQSRVDSPAVKLPMGVRYGDVRIIDPTNQTARDALPGKALDHILNCSAQEKKLSLCFTVSTAMLYTSTSFAGALTYKLGTRVARLVGWFCFTVGGLLTAFTSKDNPWLLFPGLPILGFGGIVLLITNIQIGMLFNTGRATVIASMTGLFDSSSVIMLFVKLAHENGFSHRNSMLVLCGLHVLTLVNTLLLMPRAHFTWTSDLDQTMSVSIPQDDLTTGMEGDYVLTPPRDTDTATVKMEKKSVPTLKECILSTMYLMEVAWIAILQLRFTYFLVSLNPWLHWRNIDVSYFTDVSLYTFLFGLPVSLTSGAIFDFFKTVFADQPTLERRRLFPAVVMLSMTSGIGVVMSVLVLLSTTGSLYAVFVFAALLRSFVYSVDANVVNLVYPSEYFGALFGISDFIGGTVSTLQYALVVWHLSSGFTIVNYTVLAMTALTFVHPAVQVCRVLRKGHDETPVPTPYETQPSIRPEVPPAPSTRKCSNQLRRLSSEL